MITIVVCLANLGYGLIQAIRMWRNMQKFEAMLLLALTVFITGYFLPITAAYWPTTQKVNLFLFKPISDYVTRLLHFHVEVL
jgi:hypothetical protein